ncbi:hypothetical protein PoB_002256900 [Plakobranchus ocellatus]|uniref:Uncharacterized protein n=1 Tax=Plakobranchus ocellatus TaxID=259542 RepID=A0AAV3ZNV9_9GAST|nr:hypothetical protein PoB_002256900 [Plakobranchus ocellatus]
MGNSSSQQFSETGPQYRYHENVLRDAQRRLQPLQQAEDTACFSDDDEQFYSAEEGDSSSSVTPERRRPESSSGEEQISDEESGEEELTDVGSSLVSSPLQLPSSRRSTRSYGQCNVSVFQEHDSIGPELEAASRGHENLMSRQNNSSILKRTCPTADIDQEIPKRIKLKTRRSPFQPICSGSRQQRLINCLNSSLSPGKRKIQSCIDEVAAPPNKKMLNDSPSKRKRLGYFDSSESEPDKEEEQRGRSRRKKGKLSQSVKKRKKMFRQNQAVMRLLTKRGKNQNMKPVKKRAVGLMKMNKREMKANLHPGKKEMPKEKQILTLAEPTPKLH